MRPNRTTAWCANPRGAEAAEGGCRGVRGAVVLEEPIDSRTGPTDVSTEGAEALHLGGESRGGEVVGGKIGEVGSSTNAPQRVEEVGPAGLEPHITAAAVELGVHRARRGFAGSGRQEEQNRIIERKVERLELRSVAGPELWPRREEERDIGAELPRQLAQPAGGKRIVERVVRQSERRR